MFADAQLISSAYNNISLTVCPTIALFLRLFVWAAPFLSDHKSSCFWVKVSYHNFNYSLQQGVLMRPMY